MKDNLVLGLVFLIALVAIVQFVQISAISAELTGNAIAPQEGETYEQMMARMHPDQVQHVQAAPQSPGPTMVGGC